MYMYSMHIMSCHVCGLSHTIISLYTPYFCLHTTATYVTTIRDLIHLIKQHYTIYRNAEDFN